jgi:hypothetical protein
MLLIGYDQHDWHLFQLRNIDYKEKLGRWGMNRDVWCQITEHRLTPMRHSVHTDRFSVTIPWITSDTEPIGEHWTPYQCQKCRFFQYCHWRRTSLGMKNTLTFKQFYPHPRQCPRRRKFSKTLLNAQEGRQIEFWIFRALKRVFQNFDLLKFRIKIFFSDVIHLYFLDKVNQSLHTIVFSFNVTFY